MRQLSSVLTSCAAMAVSLSAAHAAQLYVPLTNYPGDGTTLEIVVTNPDTTARTFSGAVLAEGSNGNVDTGTPTDPVTIAPLSTRVIKAPPGTGAWRLSGFDGLEISARMRVPTAVADYQGVEIPLLDSDNVHPANSTAIVQSLLAAHGYLTDFALWNASKANMRCEASVHLANGTQIGPDFLIHVAPLSLTLFENVAAVAVVPAQVTQVRIGMKCDQAFFVYSRTVNPQSGYLAVHTAASSIGDGLPNAGSTPTPTPPPPAPPPPPNSGPPPPPPPEGGRPATQAAEFRRNGEFYTVTNGERALILNMGVPANVVYSEFRVSYNFHHGGWSRVAADGIHNCGYITRGGWSGDVFMLVTARGPNRNLVRQEITVDLPRNSISQKTVNARLNPGTDYHVDYTYNHKQRKWHLVISELGGGVVVDVQGPTTGPIATKGGLWKIFFSDETTAAHVTSLGWTFSDLWVQWLP
jgi:hypothetical protein